MTNKDLIARLAALDPNAEVMILDGPNGSGSPRDLNLGPTTRTITEADAEETSDCEERVGEEVIILGFACY